MSALGLASLRRVKRWLHNRINPPGLILMYHRVAETTTDPFHLCVSPAHFAEHLSIIRQHYHALPLPQLVQLVQQGNLPKGAITITFDDGYADNLYAAKPLLEQYDIPATVFIATGNLTRQREFWSDELEHLLLQPGQLPQTLYLSIEGQNYEWDLGETATYSEEAFQRDRHWSWYTPEDADPGPRQRLYRTLYQMLQSQSLAGRQDLMDQILVWSGSQSQVRPTHRFLLPEEVAKLQSSLVEIGAHTVNHPFLSKLSVAQQQAELQQSRSQLEDLLGCPVHSFAYPHGDYGAETVALVHDAGFICACSTLPSQVRSPSNVFQLPRVGVENWNGQVFAQQLSRWFCA